MDLITRLFFHLRRFPWSTLRLLVRLVGGRISFYQLVVPTYLLDGILSAVALTAFLGGLYEVSFALPWAVRISLLVGIGTILAWRPGMVLGRCSAGMVGMALMLPLGATEPSLLTFLVVSNFLTVLLLSFEYRAMRYLWFKPLTLSNVNVGSAKLLRGSVQIIQIFVETESCPWKLSRMRSAIAKSKRACCWLTKEANRFSIPLSFQHLWLDERPCKYHGDIPSDSNDYSGRISFEGFLADCLEKYQRNVELDREEPTSDKNICLLVHASESMSTAYALPRSRGENTPSLDFEYAVVGAGTNAAVFAHEILHLFGADNFYFSGRFYGGWSEHLDLKRQAFLRRCVMFTADQSLSELCVDDQTGQKIGWR